MTGTWALVRLVLRRDRLLMPVWIIGLALAPAGYLSSIKAAYPDAAARQHFFDLNASSATFVVKKHSNPARKLFDTSSPAKATMRNQSPYISGRIS